MKKRIPIVAIVGRSNVGKSSLFNSIIGKRETIVAKESGTTRDAIWQLTEHREHSFWLVDTAGMKTAEDDFELTIQEQITQAADSADCIIVTTEANVGIGAEDRQIAKIALKSKKPVLLAINKADKVKHIEPESFAKLGITDKIAISTTQRTGISELLDNVVTVLPKAQAAEEQDVIRVALLGRPNVGKSSLFNTLIKKQEAIVSDIAGTTRDVNRRTVQYYEQGIEFSDTAGIRRQGKVEKGVEQFSVLRSLAAIEQSDICILVIDSTEPDVQLDQKIAGMVKDANRGLIIVLSKWDAVEKDSYTRDQLAARVQENFVFVPWAPLIFTSSVSGQNVARLYGFITDIYEQQHKRIKTSELNRWLQRITEKHQPAGLKRYQPRLKYMMQEDDNPTNFKVFGTHTKFLHWGYKRYMEREFRQQFGFEGTAIRFWFFDGSETKKPYKTTQQA